MENLCCVCDIRSWKIFVRDVMLDYGKFFEQVILVMGIFEHVILVMGIFEHVIFGCGKILIGACNFWLWKISLGM